MINKIVKNKGNPNNTLRRKLKNTLSVTICSLKWEPIVVAITLKSK